MATKAKPEPRPDVAKEIRLIANKLNTYGSRKPSHMLNFGMSMLKYLALYGETDSIKLQATRAVLDIPSVHALAGSLRTRTYTPPQVHQHVHLTNGAAPQPVSSADVSAIESKLAGLLGAGGEQAKAALEALEAEISEPVTQTSEISPVIRTENKGSK